MKRKQRTKITNPFYERVMREGITGGPTWHHHVFSPRCKDEVHGRFDAMDDAGGIYVLDVGRWRPVAYARTRAEAVEIAEALAAEWRPARRR